MKYIRSLLSVLMLCLMVTTSAFAVAPYDSIVTAADFSGLQTAVVGLLALAIVFPLCFKAYGLIRRVLRGV